MSGVVRPLSVGIISMTLAISFTTILQKTTSIETRPPLPCTPTIPDYSNSLYRRYISVSSARRRRPNELFQGELQSSIKRNIMKLRDWQQGSRRYRRYWLSSAPHHGKLANSCLRCGTEISRLKHPPSRARFTLDARSPGVTIVDRRSPYFSQNFFHFVQILKSS